MTQNKISTRIPDDLPPREPDGIVKGEALNFYFWLGEDWEDNRLPTTGVEPLDEPTFDFTDEQGDENVGDGGSAF